MVRKPPFIEYFIRRKYSLPCAGDEIEFIAANEKGLRKTKILKSWRGYVPWIQGIPIAHIYDSKQRRRIFLVKRKDTGAMEDWLEDYLEFPNPDWHLLGVLNRERANRAAALRRALE
jgi:hypothetical protein